MVDDMHIVHRVLSDEAKALSLANQEIDTDKESYLKVIQTIKDCEGHIIFMGVGKTGHIGKKLAATFASLGTPAFFVDATESMHGDLGMITSKDVVILISNSGETKETLAPVRFIKRIGAKTIAITRNKQSTLAKECDLDIIAPVKGEADKLNLAPTNSSTVALAIGDALACAVSESNNFSKLDFAGFHPGGALGKQLLSSDNGGK